MSGPVINTLHVLTLLIISLQSRYCYHLRFSNEATEQEMLNNLPMGMLLVSDQSWNLSPGSLPLDGMSFWLLSTPGSLRSGIEDGAKKIRR